MNRRSVAVWSTVAVSLLALGSSSVTKAAEKPLRTASQSRASSRASIVAGRSNASTSARRPTDCVRCGVQATNASQKIRASKKGQRTAKAVPCHPKNYVDPKIARNYRSALRDMNRAGIKPRITSMWRSSRDQAKLHRCSLSARCRGANPGLYRALPPGESLHEAGFAVDISGVATGPRGDKELTPRGRRIIGIMRKNGFKWRYGLADPAHFEADPKKYGYRSTKHAIARTQNTCQTSLATKSRPIAGSKAVGNRTRATLRATLRAEARAAKAPRRIKARA